MPIESIHNEDGYCIAYCEWTPRDKHGNEDFSGEYVFVNEMWVHPVERGYSMVKDIVKKVIEKYPHGKFTYWKRRKYSERVKLFSKGQIYKTKEV